MVAVTSVFGFAQRRRCPCHQSWRASCMLLCCAQRRGHAAHCTDRHPRWVDHRQLAFLQTKRFRACIAACSRTEPQFLLAAYVPMNSCTAPRRHGKITHQPEDVPYGCGPDLPCHPPLFMKTSGTSHRDGSMWKNQDKEKCLQRRSMRASSLATEHDKKNHCWMRSKSPNYCRQSFSVDWPVSSTVHNMLTLTRGCSQ